MLVIVVFLLHSVCFIEDTTPQIFIDIYFKHYINALLLNTYLKALCV